jgi:transcription antitermination factor NusG
MWYALYVKSRHEKKVASLLSEKGLDVYVPLRKVLKQWSDRKKWVEEPVISCYVFVNMLGSQRDNVLQTRGVVGFVRNNRKDATIPDEEMNIMRDILNVPDISVTLDREDLHIGELCEVVAGPMIGKKVKLYEIRGKKKVGVYIDDLKMGLTLEINPSCLKPLKESVLI